MHRAKVVQHAKINVVQQQAMRKQVQQYAKGRGGEAACKGKSSAACKGQKGDKAYLQIPEQWQQGQ